MILKFDLYIILDQDNKAY